MGASLRAHKKKRKKKEKKKKIIPPLYDAAICLSLEKQFTQEVKVGVFYILGSMLIKMPTM